MSIISNNWTKWIDLSSTEVAWSCAADPSNNLYVAGRIVNYVSSPIVIGVDTSNNEFTHSRLGSSDTGLLIKYNPLGQIIWSRAIDTSGATNETPRKVALDSSGNVFFAGTIGGNSLSIGRNYYYTTYNPSTGLVDTILDTFRNDGTNWANLSVFLFKYSPDGEILSKNFFEGVSNASVSDLKINNNTIYLSLGIQTSVNTPLVNANTYFLENNHSNGYLSCINAIGWNNSESYYTDIDLSNNLIIASNYSFTTSDNSQPTSLRIYFQPTSINHVFDTANNITIPYQINANYDSSFNRYQGTNRLNTGASYGFRVLKVDPSGIPQTDFWIDGSGTPEQINSIKIDNYGNILLAGTSYVGNEIKLVTGLDSSNQRIITTVYAPTPSLTGTSLTGFVIKYNSSNRLQQVLFIDGVNILDNDNLFTIYNDHLDNIYALGFTNSDRIRYILYDYSSFSNSDYSSAPSPVTKIFNYTTSVQCPFLSILNTNLEIQEVRWIDRTLFTGFNGLNITHNNNNLYTTMHINSTSGSFNEKIGTYISDSSTNIIDGFTTTKPATLTGLLISKYNINIPINPPSITDVIPGNSSALILFSDLSNNSVEITNYTITSSPGNLTQSGTSSPILITGLTNGTSYTFTITATDGNNTSNPSLVSNSITPVGVNLSEILNNNNLDTTINSKTRTNRKNLLRNTLKQMTLSRINTISFSQLSPYFSSSIYNINNISSKTFKMVLLDSNDNFTGDDSKMLDFTSEYNSNNVIYLPLTSSNTIKFTVGTTFNNSPKTYTISNVTESNGNVTSFQISSNDLTLTSPTTISSTQTTYGDLYFSIFGGAGFEQPPPPPSGGAGSDPYITTIYGMVYELPKVTKWWNLFKSDSLDIKAHTQNYSKGNFFNQIIITHLKHKVIIDFQKRTIINHSKTPNILIGKLPYRFKFNKSNQIINSTSEETDAIQIYGPEFKELLLLINWENHYLLPVFKEIPKGLISGLIVSKPKSIGRIKN